jgi:hypothetical protein
MRVDVERRNAAIVAGAVALRPGSRTQRADRRQVDDVDAILPPELRALWTNGTEIHP